ncbi:MAG: hypothetical protein H7Y15_08235 [Pseudonocardia sp.]|nr:hypothetical protein [Pseudonocardia sp.]
MSNSIAPKSDQMNAEDLLSGPRTFTIARVRVTETPDQPVLVYLDGFPADRPFKPSKTVRRLMVVAWGADSTAYVGKRLTLYRDPEVKWGGMDVGGIRVSHMSGLAGPLNVALTVTRGRRAPYTVDPLPDGPAADRHARLQPGPSLSDRVRRMVGGFASLAVTEDDLARKIGRPRAGWAEDDLNRMTDVYTLLSTGNITREEVFPRSDVTADDLPPDPAPDPHRPGTSVDGDAPDLPPGTDGIDFGPPAPHRVKAMFAELRKVGGLEGGDGREDRLALFSAVAERRIDSTTDLTAAEVVAVIKVAGRLVEKTGEDRQDALGGLVVMGKRLRPELTGPALDTEQP